MSRRMSCSLTIDAVRARSKTVTRRHIGTWTTLRPGDRLTLVEKAMGLPKGARQVVLAEVEVVMVGVENLWLITADECAREGFPEMTPGDFIEMWRRSHGLVRQMTLGEFKAIPVRRIEWRYLDGGES